ncbi:MAG TPA: PQQ-binding-like beta-propeller repeat protein, partial [Rhizomicrobium sp.]|nr:PQQ-binding-like beta-propeller repeat protein [Rhizomicrobium sp.]
MRKIVLALLAASLPLSVTAAPAGKPGDWPEYGYDSGGGRYSPLTQITPDNVNRLQPAWTYHMNPEPQKPLARVPFATTTPLVVDGRMFLGTPYGRVVALDATTGK